MAPLDDLLNLVLISFKDGLNMTLPPVFDPAIDSQSKSRLVSMVAKEDPLDPSFNDHVCPCFVHIDYVENSP